GQASEGTAGSGGSRTRGGRPGPAGGARDRAADGDGGRGTEGALRPDPAGRLRGARAGGGHLRGAGGGGEPAGLVAAVPRRAAGVVQPVREPGGRGPRHPLLRTALRARAAPDGG